MKWEYNDSIVYKVRQLRYDVILKTFFIDTFNVKYSENIFEDLKPGIPFAFTNENVSVEVRAQRIFYKFNYFLSNRLANNRLVKYEVFSGAIHSQADTNCISFGFSFGNEYEVEYIESLGMTYCYEYHTPDAVFSGHLYEKKLIHYKKGNEVWGESYPFPLSVNETAVPESISIFPNPAHDFVTISISEPAMVTLFDMTGKAVESYSLSQTENISTESLSAGIYFIQVNSGKYTKQIKLVVQH
jgi:hypothetical protein